jgi:hypothetical protein
MNLQFIRFVGTDSTALDPCEGCLHAGDGNGRGYSKPGGHGYGVGHGYCENRNNGDGRSGEPGYGDNLGDGYTHGYGFFSGDGQG